MNKQVIPPSLRLFLVRHGLSEYITPKEAGKFLVYMRKGRSAHKTAKELGISYTTYYRWLRELK